MSTVKEESIQRSPIAIIAARVGLWTLQAVRTTILSIGQGLSYVGAFFSPIRDGFTRWIALPIYRISFFTQLRIRKTVASTRGLVFLLFTSRYTLHILLSAFALPIAFTQLRPASANADVGQRSILYALVTNGQSSITEETSADVSPLASSYLDDTVVARNNIDFDYDINDTDPTTDHGIAGTIAVRPQPSALVTDSGDEIPAPPAIADATTDPTPAAPPQEKTTEVVTYTVKSGDTIARIAQRYGISQNTVIWANDLTLSSRLKPGDELKILPVSGVLYTVKRGETLASIAQKFNVSLSTLRSGNDSLQTLSAGKTLIVPGGRPLQAPAIAVATPTPSTPTAPAKTPKVTSGATVRPDVPIARIKNKAFDIYQELASTNTDTRDKPADEDVPVTQSLTKLLWPTARHVINQYYGWAHTGVDIDGDYTDPIYAAADGAVTEAGWNSGGYGLQVVIEHDGGLKTRYGHASKLFVKAGEDVKRGQVIGYVGTTGRSTGTHLHFEVYKNGKRGNPLAYIK